VSDYFLDSSALVKRYLTETGSDWVRALADPGTGNTIVVAGITRVEVAAALAGRHRAPDGVSLEERDAAVYLLLEHFEMEYGITPLDPEIIGRAAALTQTHYLRGYDAVQLATALAANESLAGADLPNLAFIASDDDDLVAAGSEDLPADDPNRHS